MGGLVEQRIKNEDDFSLPQNTSRNSFFRANWDIGELQGNILAVSYTGCDLLLAYKSILIKCVDLLIKRVDLSETCCTHWVDVLAELL